MKVILCDSNMITSSKIAGLLRSSGYEVLTSNSHQKVSDLIGEAGVIAVIINLEGFGSKEMLEEIKEVKRNLPVIAFCGHKNTRLQEYARKMGADLVVPNSRITSEAPQILESILGSSDNRD